MNETIQSHLQLTANIFKSHGFHAVIKGSRVEISLRNRNVYTDQVEMVIDQDELPIDRSQLVYACGNTCIKFKGYC